MGSTEEQLKDEIRILPQEECAQLIASGVFTATRECSGPQGRSSCDTLE